MSIKQLLIAMAVVSLYFAAMFGASNIFGSLAAIGFCVVSAVLPSAAIAGVLYCRGAARAFWIGACPPIFAAILLAYTGIEALIHDFHDYDTVWTVKYTLLGFHMCAVLGGGVSVAIRWANGDRTPSLPR